MEEKNNKKKKVMILVLVLGLVLLTVGTTYAFFTYSRQGVEEHVLTTGSLYFVYDELPNEEDSNQISIGNAFPVSDDKGMKQEKPGMFEFEVRAKNQGADINYEIYLTKGENSTLPEKVVDTYLTTTGKKGENSAETLAKPTWENKWTKDNGVTQYQFLYNSHVPVLEEGQQGKSLYQETIPSTNEEEYSKIFRYRMWLDESAEGVNAKGEWIYGGKSFTVRVNVYASNEELPMPTPVGVMQSWAFDMENDEPPETDFHTADKKFSISNIRFENKIEIPQEVSQENQWDISEKQDGSVMAYMIPNEGETCQDIMSYDGGTIPCNDIVIASNGETYGNPDSSYAFYFFISLKTIDFTNYNASLIENTGAMFYYCMNLASLDLSSWDTSSVTDIDGMFYCCIALTSLDLSNWDTSSVTDMSRIFYECYQLVTITGLENWYTSSVTDMSFMFASTKVGDFSFLENWDVSNVTDMSEMFQGCSNLTTLYLSNWDTSSLTTVSDFDGDWYLGMFAYCENLKTVNLSNWNMSKVTTLAGMFTGCSQLSEIIGIEDWDTSNVSITGFYKKKDGMFYDCSQLTNLDLSKWNTSKFTDTLEMFYGCSKLNATITIRGNVTSYDGMFQDAATEEGASITVNYVDDATMAIAQAMVETANGNQNVKLGEKVA